MRHLRDNLGRRSGRNDGYVEEINVVHIDVKVEVATVDHSWR